MQSVSWLAMFAIATTCVVAHGQSPDEATPPAGAAAASLARFDAALAAYKASLKQVEELRGSYRSASAAQKKQIDAQAKQALTAAQGHLQQMVAAGLDAYRADPQADERIQPTLMAVAGHYAQGVPIPDTAGDFSGGDQYERALPVIDALVEGGNEDPSLRVWGLVSAVNTNQFDKAARYAEEIRAKDIFANGPPEEDDATLGVWGTAMEYATRLDEFRSRWEKEQAIRQQEAAADNLPRVKIETSKGPIVIELFEDQAPVAAANFITLAKQGYYDGVVFHRVLQGFMAQGGDPKGTGEGGPGYCIADECARPDARMHFRGSLSMAKTAAPDSGGSQFFLCFVPTTHLDNRHTVFGRVVEGIEVLGELQRLNPGGSGTRPKPDSMVKVTVLRDRGHAYEFEKLPNK